MKKLYLMRHAKSSWGESSVADHDRPLNLRGQGDAAKVGEYLAGVGLHSGVIVCSTALRARQTLEYLLQTLSFDGEVKYSRGLYHAGTEEFLNVLRDLPDSVHSVMLVGHNPGMEMAVEDLTGEWVRMATAAVAEIALEIERWPEIDENSVGTLRSVVQPRDLG